MKQESHGTTAEGEVPPDPDAAALAEDLRRAIGTFVRAVRKGADVGRSAQDETLGLLAREGAKNVAALSQARNVKHQTMRLVAAQLEAASLVRSDPDPHDGRSRLLTISEAGRAHLERGQQARAARIADLIRTTLSEGDRDTLRAGIALIERLSISAAS